MLAVCIGAGCPDWEHLSTAWGAVDATPAPDASLCQPSAEPSVCPAAPILCDGFEDDLLSDGTWEVKAKQASVTLDKSCSYRGNGAVRLETLETPTGETIAANIHSRNALLGATGTVSIRAHLLVERYTLASATKLMQYRQHGATSTGGVKLFVADRTLLVENTLTGQTTSSSTELPIGRWVCLELQVTDGTPGRVRFFLDGTLLIDESQNTVAMPVLDTVGVGVINLDTKNPQPPIRIWIDEVAVASETIGCHP